MLHFNRRLVLSGGGAACLAGIAAATWLGRPHATPRRSYYAPVERTTIMEENPFWVPPEPIMAGEVRDMVVASDMARRVYGFIDGRQAWALDLEWSWPRGIELFEGRLFVAFKAGLLVVDPKSGVILDRMPEVADVQVNGVHVWRDPAGAIGVTICTDKQGRDAVRYYILEPAGLRLIRSGMASATNPRHAIMTEMGLIVANTFGHVVELIDPITTKVLASTWAYYPNSVQRLDSGRVLICSEHANQVLTWQPETGRREIVFSAPISPFDDPSLSLAEIIEAEASTGDDEAGFSPSPSKAAVRSSGAATLYSPNSARLYGSDLFVADTDNHRVVLIRGGSVVTEVAGFNNPVTALLI